MARITVPYLKLRAGRPRWEPSPALRARGFKGRDLKDPETGAWMDDGAAIATARAINEALEEGRDEGLTASPRTLSLAAAEYKLHRKFTTCAPKTQKEYRKLLRILEAWAGDVDVRLLPRKAINAFYAHAVEHRGVAMANALIRVLSIVLNHATHELEWCDKNRAARFGMQATDGRLVVWSTEEILAFVAAAYWCGWPEHGDAAMLGVLTGQRQADVVALGRGDMKDGMYVIRPQKRRGAVTVFIPITEPLRRTVVALRARADVGNVTHTLEIVSSVTGQPFDADLKDFRTQFRAVRAIASGLAFSIEDAMRAIGGLPPTLRNLPFAPLPSIIDKRWQDLRDTAVTWLFAASCSIAEIATITGHSLKTVQAILDKHYFVRNEALAISAGAKLEAYLGKMGVTG